MIRHRECQMPDCPYPYVPNQRAWLLATRVQTGTGGASRLYSGPERQESVPALSFGAASRPSYLDLVRDRVVVFDGAMGTSIQNYNLDEAGYGGIEGCNEFLVLHNPGLIEEVHASFLEVGVDVIETDTFGGSQLKLAEYGLGDRTYDVNREAAALARRVADRYSGGDQPRYVAGSIGPTGLLPASEDPLLGNHRFGDVVELFVDQVR